MNVAVLEQTPGMLGIIATSADAVDREGRFPHEAVAALRADTALSAMIPPTLGGQGEGIAQLARRCHALGQVCASAGMVFAMHQIQIACLVHHGAGHPWHEELLSRIAREQLLLASMTSEVGTGGDIRRSLCAVETEGDRIALHKKSTAMSYGAEADILLITARRAPAADNADQVLVVGLAGQYRLERTGTWDSLGMRGTCSHPYDMALSCGAEQIIPVPYGDIGEQTMQPVSHLLWSALWSGIAADAVFRARNFLRARARAGSPVPSLPRARLAEATGLAQMMEARLGSVLHAFDEAWRSSPHGGPHGGPVPLTIEQAASLNALKVSTSETALAVVNHAMTICGIEGYRNGTPFSLGRHLRDLHSAPLMISNERIRESTGNMLLMQKPQLGAW